MLVQSKRISKAAAGSLIILFWSLLFPNLGIAQQPSNLLESLEANQPDNKKLANDIKPQDVIHWTAIGAEIDPKKGEIELLFSLRTESQFTIYSDKLEWLPPEGWSFESQILPATARQIDPITNKEVAVFFGGEFKVKLSGPKSEVPPSFAFAVKYVGCTQIICLFPYTQKLTFPVTVATPAKDVSSNSAISEEKPAAPTAGSPPIGSFEEQVAKRVKDGSMGLGMLLLFAFVGGLLTNLTPCVAPMIPITIRLLAKQGPKPFLGSSMYALGIVATYTVLGVFAAMSGALFGNLIAHPVVSISFGIIMALLGLSMLGFGDLSQLQQIGGRIGSGKGGPMNAFLMGTGAGLVASPCTGPILAALLTYTAGRSSVTEATALLGVYSVGFALPYVFLGASAAKISKVKVNFTIQIATKLIFAAVMFGLSFYFLRIPLYGVFTALQSSWGSIAAISGLVGVSLMGLFIVKSELAQKKFLMIIPSFLVGTSLFFGIQYLTRPSQSAHDSLVWYKSEQEAFEASNKANKPILVDAWAEWCEACKKMDVTTFAEPKVIKELSASWILYKMDLTEPTDENVNLQDRYGLPGLPTLTLLPVGGDLAKKKALNGYVSAETLLDELGKFGRPSP